LPRQNARNCRARAERFEGEDGVFELAEMSGRRGKIPATRKKTPPAVAPE
jgi:hypothetical protein